MVSRKFVEAVKLADQRAYVIAQKAGLNPSTLSKILNGIDQVKPGDLRVLRVGEILGLQPEQCFEGDSK